MSTQEQEVDQMSRRLKNFHCRYDLREYSEELLDVALMLGLVVSPDGTLSPLVVMMLGLVIVMVMLIVVARTMMRMVMRMAMATMVVTAMMMMMMLLLLFDDGGDGLW